MARKKKPTSRKNKKKRSGAKSGKRASKGAEDPATHGPAAAAAPVAEAPPESPEEENVEPIVLEDDELAVIDLDDDQGEYPVERLIAEAIANALPEEALEPPEPVIDLDAALEGEEGEPVGVAPSADVGQTVDASGDAGPGIEERPAESVAADSRAATEGAAVDDDARRLPRQEIADEVARRLVDLGPVSSPEVRDRLLAEALAHAEHQEARYRIPFSTATAVARWKALAGTLILLLAGVLALAPPGWARPEPPPPLAAEERARNLRVALLLQAQQIEAFRVRTQQLPSSLDEVPETLPGVRYVRSGTRAYQLIAYEPNGSAVVYDSTDPGPAFAGLTVGWRSAP